MSRDWESTFRSWSKPSSDTEATKCVNATEAVKKAIQADEDLSQRSITIIPQGSYHNGTNVRLDSDVDLCICCTDQFFFEFFNSDVPAEQIPQLKKSLDILPTEYKFSQYKNEVEQALVNRFGRFHVERGNKAFDIHENTYRIDADAVPAFEHRRYTQNSDTGKWSYISGVQLFSDDGKTIVNWPQQQHENGVRKNNATGGLFKNITRVIKHLRNEMKNDGIVVADPIPSFLIECLVWNVPNDLLSTNSNYVTNVREALAHTFNATLSDDKCSEWGEVSELKYLFRPTQGWTRQQVNQFLGAAWDYVGYE